MDTIRALSFSRYATRTLDAEPELAAFVSATSAQPFVWDDARATLTATDAEDDPEALAIALRRLRRRVFLHTLARDLLGLAPLTEVCGAMTQLAELAIHSAIGLHARRLAKNHGEPLGADDGVRQSLIAIGMGKLGGGELNVSSDIDLVFAYPDEGDTAGPRKIANREFFDRLGQRVIAALHDVTPEVTCFGWTCGCVRTAKAGR
jgi:glutamate-ammonia-ligase adenylyltransferase